MFYVYVLQSEKNYRSYIGFTPDLKERIKRHNNGEVYWTKRHMPWRLIYYEAYISRTDALERERQLKRFAKGFAQLKRRLRHTLKELQR